jgi:hypothetical protein
MTETVDLANRVRPGVAELLNMALHRSRKSLDCWCCGKPRIADLFFISDPERDQPLYGDKFNFRGIAPSCRECIVRLRPEANKINSARNWRGEVRAGFQGYFANYRLVGPLPAEPNPFVANNLQAQYMDDEAACQQLPPVLFH